MVMDARDNDYSIYFKRYSVNIVIERRCAVKYPNYAFVLVGDCRVGKTTLASVVVKKMRLRILIIASLTTRAPRDENDKRFSTCISTKRFEEKITSGDFAEFVRIGEHYYGHEQAQLEHVLRSRHGICDATQQGVNELLRRGYNVKPIRIIGKNHEHIQRSFYEKYPDRKDGDSRYNVIPVPYSCTIVNNFTLGGLQIAAQELVAFVRRHK